MEKAWTIGRLDGPMEYQFIGVYGMTVGPDGSAYVVDRGAGDGGSGAGASVRQYDRDGKFVRSFGRSGDGPGEWIMPVDVDLLPDGRVLVLDPQHRRINVYTVDGRFLAHWSTNDKGGVDQTFDRLHTDVAGNSYLRLSLIDARTSQFSSAFERYDRNGRVIDTLVPPASTVAAPGTTFIVAGVGDRPNRSARIPFVPGFSYVRSSLGYWITFVTSRYAIDLRLPSNSASGVAQWQPGMPVTSIRRSTPVVDIPADERDAHRRAIEETLRLSDPRWSWTGPEIPGSKPPIQSVRDALDGRIWVQLSTPAVRRLPADTSRAASAPNRLFAAPAVFDVFEPNGVYAGQVRLPDDLTPYKIRGDDIFSVGVSLEGVPTISRWRVAWR